MPKRCVAASCGKSSYTGQSVHNFPKDPHLRKLWVKFVSAKRPNFTVPVEGTYHGVLCGEHFTHDCFQSEMQTAMGLKTRKTLKPGALPTIHSKATLPNEPGSNDGHQTKMKRKSMAVHKLAVKRSNEVTSSNACELEGLKRVTEFLVGKHKLPIAVMVTDRHRSINRYIREELKKSPQALEMKHYYDCWHVAKGLGKKIDAISKQKDCSDVRLWRHSIINHLYFVAATTPVEEEDLREAKWKSIINHIQDIHVHDTHLFQNCQHPDLSSNARNKQWLESGSKACVLLSDVLEEKALLKDLKRMSPIHQTSSLEAFHSLIVRYAPKHTSFMWLAQYARYCLAGLHFNENSNRLQAVSVDGRPQYTLRFPKYKKNGHSVAQVKTATTYAFTKKLMDSLFTEYAANSNTLKNSIKEMRIILPRPLTKEKTHPNKEQAIKMHQSRFHKH